MYCIWYTSKIWYWIKLQVCELKSNRIMKYIALTIFFFFFLKYLVLCFWLNNLSKFRHTAFSKFTFEVHGTWSWFNSKLIIDSSKPQYLQYIHRGTHSELASRVALQIDVMTERLYLCELWPITLVKVRKTSWWLSWVILEGCFLQWYESQWCLFII